MKHVVVKFVVVFVAAAGLAIMQAAPIQYTIQFSGNGPLPTSGDFTYAAVTPQFSAFQVVWNGGFFDLTSAANNATFSGVLNQPACFGSRPGAALSFAVLTGCASAATNGSYWSARGFVGPF